ncbi:MULTISPECIES: FecR family protein [unclassified Sphingomonas]|uniref:FecR family protein n=1 Tax=unclassified Sphingomonas TaxID=196159 RepID=UPI000446838D|nr:MULTISPECIES: FecR domain-containing protein [unclassified Sphingomonas]EZP53703.1 FecR family protein [Sphingomonas sp. RIT328]EZP53706.1 FecR family protein [Sphingomonas sp. RIT328]
MIDDIACRWAAAIDRGLDAAEAAALPLWLAEDRRHRGALLRAQATLSLLDRGRALSGANPAEAATAPPARRWRFAGAAAGTALVAGLAVALWPAPVARIDTGVGEVRRMPLADGSVALVNSGTSLRVAFTPGRRDVEVRRGEAWFQVAHNPARPFVVASGPVRVQAVGTAFDVRRQGDAARVVVTKGVVRIWSVASPDAAITVPAGRYAVLNAGEAPQVRPLSPQASDQQLAWREGRIVLDDMTLGAAAAEFNRYNSDRLEVAPPLAGRRVVGWFRTYDVDGFATASAAMVGGRVERHHAPDGTEVTRIVP